jgi:type I restriction enzyme S subunit
MAREWKRTSLREAGVTLIDCDHRTPPAADSGYPYVAIPQLKEGRVLLNDVRRISPENFAEWTRKAKPQHHDVILSRRCNPGETAYVPEGLDCALGQNLVLLRADGKRVFPPFLRWLVRGRDWWEQVRTFINVGAVFDSLKCADIPNFRVPLPPLAEQKAIAAVLGALDDKIELNLRMNATLEAMARALFQSWFVDFDPVRAKLDGRQPVGLDQDTAELFPDSFQDSVIGHIPHDWKVGVLNDLSRFVIGGDWGATEPNEDQFVSCYCVRGADIPSLQSGGIGKMPTRFLKPSSVEKRHLADGDLAIEISGGSPSQCTGRPVLVSDALLQSLGQPLVASNFCRIVKLKSPALSKFVYLWLRRLYEAGELFQFETGTTGIKNFAFVIFSERYPLVVPDPRVAEAFDCAVSPFFARIQANSKESRSLANLRNTLLPKLLSGELSVAAAKETMEMAR